MFEYLAAYLAVVCGPEQRDRLLSGCELLSQLGIEGHVFAIDQQLELAENADTTITLQSIEAIVIETERAVLNDLGVEVADNLPLGMVTDILRSLDGLTNYDDHSGIVALIDEGNASVETLATLLPLLGESNEDDYLQALLDVNPGLLVRLRDLNDNASREYDELPAPELVDRSRQRLRQFIKRHKELAIEKAIRENSVRLGIDVEVLIDHLSDALHEVTPERFGIEIAGIYLASNVDEAQFVEGAQSQVNAFYADLRSATSAQQSAIKAFTEVTCG